MEKRIDEFIKKQTTASICCVDKMYDPHCFSCFYAIDVEKGLLYFKSSTNSHHASLLQDFVRVSGTIQPDKLNPLIIKGIQFSGLVLPPEATPSASTIYHARFPMALAMSGRVWTIRLDQVKMTDSTTGFGQKTSWKREPERVKAEV